MENNNFRGAAHRLVHLFGRSPVPEGEERRITVGDNFSVVGGSKIIHEGMTDDILRFCDIAKHRFGKTVEQLSPQEIEEIMEEIHYR